MPVNFQALATLGFSEFFRKQLSDLDFKKIVIGRIVSQHSGFFDVMTGPDETVKAFLSGRIKHKTNTRAAMPAAGDWVLMEKVKGDKFPITDILKRSSEIKRKVYDRDYEQILAANVDLLFLVHSADDGFSLSRLEKYCYIAETNRVPYAVILNKTDRCADTAPVMERITALAGNAPLIPLDSLKKKGYENLEKLLEPRKTSVFIGPSGAGKSTIINNLYGGEIMKTQTIKEKDLKGKHTTTTRKIIILPNGHLIMDTPGIKIIEFDDSIIGLDKFEPIRSLAPACRFSDCKHDTEPGCAVKKAVEDGGLSRELYAAYMKLAKETGFNSMTAFERREKDRKFGKFLKKAKKDIKKRE